MLIDSKRQIENRNKLSSFFITMLIALAFEELIPVARDSVRDSGLETGTMLLFAIFFLTAMRFFIGNLLHLLSGSLAKRTGGVWLYDLMAIIIQSLLLIFLGGVSSVAETRDLEIGFVEILVALYLVDIFWIGSQWLLGKLFRSWRRDSIPWQWAALNGVLVIAILVLQERGPQLYSDRFLLYLFVINLIGFVVDVLMVDRYNALWRGKAESRG